MSGLPIRSMLYQGATTRIIGHYEPWFNGKHTVDPTRHPGYKSNDPSGVSEVVNAVKAAGVDIFMVNWYGEGSYEDQCTKVLVAQLSAQHLGLIINIDGGIITNLTALQAHVNYVRSTYFPFVGYEKFNGKYIVTYFAKAGNQPAWFRQVESENPDILFVYNGTAWGKSQMAWVQSNLQADCDNFCKTYSKKTDGLYIPSASAGFNDLNSLTGYGVWGAKPARIWPAGGPNWGTFEAYFTTINRYYSTSNQLPYLQLVTINDEDEGTGLLSRGFLLAQTPPQKASHLEIWVDGKKLGDLQLALGSKNATMQEVENDNGNVLGKVQLTLV